MQITDKLDGCLAETIGANGLTKEQLIPWLQRTQRSVEKLQGEFDNGTFPLLTVPSQTQDLADLAKFLPGFLTGMKNLVFYGTGGSSLGGQTVAQIGGWFIPGDKMPGEKQKPRIRFYDNLDPRTLVGSLKELDLKKTKFVVISKSGSTAEPLLQTAATIQAMEEAGLGDQVKDHILAISEPRKEGATNRLRDLLEPYKVTFFEHDTRIGGRYSCLTNVGLLPGMVKGLDVSGFRRGAARVVQRFRACKQADHFAPALGAAIIIALAEEKGIRNQVMMPYADRLARFANWYVQLVAESLGKDGRGIMPIAAVGPVDQHSQLQFFMDGPAHHMITIIELAREGKGPIIRPDMATKIGLPMMGDRAIGDFSSSQPAATAKALMQAGRPVRVISLSDINEDVAGSLLMRFMLETIITADMLGVNPYDQPAVEIGKKISLDSLS